MRKLLRISVLLFVICILQLMLIGCNKNDETLITFDGTNITVKGDGATANGNVVTITATGHYRLTGTLTEGQVVVDSVAGKAIYLHLDNMSVTCSTASPFVVKNAVLCAFVSVDGTLNTITDNSPHKDGSDAESVFSNEPDAAIYSKAPLLLKGEGSGKLVVNANSHNGISTSDTLTIDSGNLTVDAKNNGLRGKDFVVISGGNVNIKADNYAIKSTNTEDASLGYINITGGNLIVNAGDDGVYAPNSISISGANVTLKSKNVAFKTEGKLSFTSGIIDISTKNEDVFVCESKTFEAAAIITLNGNKYTE